MSELWWTFQACGWTAWLCLLAALLLVPVVIAALALAVLRSARSRVVAWGALGLCFLPLCIGAVGMMLGQRLVDEVVPALEEEHRERIRREGYAEARQCMVIGSGLSALPALGSLVALGFAYAFGTRTDEGKRAT